MTAPGTIADRDDQLRRALDGDRRALAQVVTTIELGGPGADAVAIAVHGAGRGAAIVGITGAPGSGKSTITGRLLGRLGAGTAVLAIDPSSPRTGGAILGDRVRMDPPEGTFVRSMANRGASGGLAVAVPGVVDVLDAAGFDPILLETVGVGQVEVDVAGAADTTVVVVTPGWGDAVQANKAGLLEVADVLVVNKADRPGVDDARRDLELMLDLGALPPDGWRPPIVTTVATTGEGVDELWAAVGRHRDHLVATGTLAERRAARAAAEVRSRIDQELRAAVDVAMCDPDAVAALDEVRDGSVAPVAAARQLARKVLRT